RVLDDDARRAAVRDQRLDLRQSRIGMMAFALGRAEIANDAPASAADGEEGENAVAMPEEMQAVPRLEPADHAVGEIPVAGLRGALEGEAQPVTHCRMGAVAAQEPIRRQRLAFAIGLAQHRLHLVALLAEALQGDGAFDLDA